MSAIIDESHVTDYAGGIVYVCSGDKFPDALVASGVSRRYPVILTEKDHLSTQALNQLKKIKPDIVRIIGGESVVSKNAYNEIYAYMKSYTTETPRIERIYGNTRYDTAKAVLDSELHEQQDGTLARWWTGTVIVVSGEDFPDALSAASLTFADCLLCPIVLADPNSGLIDGILSSLKAAKFENALIIGGEKALSKTVENQLSSIGISSERIWGLDRYETSLKVAKWGLENTHGYSDTDERDPYLNMSAPIFATGSNFPDALAAGQLAHWYRSPIILVGNDGAGAVELCRQYKSDIKRAYVVGGSKAVTNSLASSLASASGLTLQ